jgi:small neutral amino acid transporter SnatA (MarC family)
VSTAFPGTLVLGRATDANLRNPRFSPSGIRILVRIMGLLVVALAAQFFINGLTDLGLIAKSA